MKKSNQKLKVKKNLLEGRFTIRNYLFLLFMITNINFIFADGPPVIITQPQSQTVTEGDSVALYVSVTGSQPLTYYWFKNDIYLPGIVDSILILNPVQLDDSGTFRCKVSNPYDEIMSDDAELIVNEGIHFAPKQQKVFSSAGGNYNTGNYMLSTTIGESVIGTYCTSTNKTTTGFQQPHGIPLVLDLKVYLDGPWNGSYMNFLLSIFEHLPLSQPYNQPPWNYGGSESVTDIPSIYVVDWVLVELRETEGDASTATPETTIGKKAALLMSDGRVTGIGGLNPIYFSHEDSANIYVVVWHRNHLGIMSALPMVKVDGVMAYDFTTDEGKVHGGANGHKELASGKWGMVAADGNADGQIDNKDKNDVWFVQLGNTGYCAGDFNLSGVVDNYDKGVWDPNAGKGGKVPE